MGFDLVTWYTVHCKGQILRIILGIIGSFGGIIGKNLPVPTDDAGENASVKLYTDDSPQLTFKGRGVQ